MDEATPHLLTTFITNNMENSGCEHPLIKFHFKAEHKKSRLKPDHYLVDLLRGHKVSESDMIVICDRTKPISLPQKRVVVLWTVLFSFFLGMFLGAVISMYLAQNPTSQVAAFRKSCNIKKPPSNNSVVYVYDELRLENLEYRLKSTEKLFWSVAVEKSIPAGFGHEDDRQWNEFIKTNTIVKIEEGCGRMQNRLVTFEDGTKACCRYRQNTDQIQGEMFSYYLARLLRLENVVPSALDVINISDPRWFPVRNQLASSNWADDHPVVLTKYVEGLLSARIPPSLRSFIDIQRTSGDTLSELSLPVFHEKNSASTEVVINSEDSVELAQWSDLVIFDYLTANLDRVVNNLYNLQWNPAMLSSPAHNLARTSGTGLLVFLDNESGLLHGYRLLEKYEPYHSLLLNGVCVFRRSTVDALFTLNRHGHWSSRLSAGDILPSLPDKNVGMLKQRINRVLQHVLSCSRSTYTQI